MIKLPYGSNYLEFDLDNCSYTTLSPKIPNPKRTADEIIQSALQNPIKSSINPDFSKKTIGIAINDPTRPVPHKFMLPLLVEFLLNHGASSKKIHFYIANGTHFSVPQKKIEEYLPEAIWKDFKIENHECDDKSNLEYLGGTIRDTPIYINKRFLSHEIKIVTGNIEPHHFMGYSGGVKSASIGLAGRKTIESNHEMLKHPDAKMGMFNKNPMRQDIEEIGTFIGVDYALNVVINAKKEINACFWGEPKEVIEAGIQYNREEIQLEVTDLLKSFDLVIASPGGFPKDINLYQAQKAITHACLFAKEKAPILLAAECREGHGSSGFYDFFEDIADFAQVIEKFNRMKFVVGPHKSYQLALQGINHKIYLKSEIAESEVNHFFLSPIENLQEDIQNIIKKEKIKTVLVLPYATTTIPVIEDY